MKILLIFGLATGLLAQSAESYVAAARQAEAKGDLAAAERDYEKALALRPDAAVYQRLGLVRHLQNKYSAAIPAFRQALKRQPGQWASHLFLGIDLYRTNAFAEALPHLVEADRLSPGQPEARFWLGATHLALKHYLEGLSILEELYAREPRNVEVVRLLAQHYAIYSTALLDHVADAYPDSPAGMQVHAEALEFEGAAPEALAAYRALEQRAPGRPGVAEAIKRLSGAE